MWLNGLKSPTKQLAYKVTITQTSDLLTSLSLFEILTVVSGAVFTARVVPPVSPCEEQSVSSAVPNRKWTLSQVFSLETKLSENKRCFNLIKICLKDLSSHVLSSR